MRTVLFVSDIWGETSACKRLAQRVSSRLNANFKSHETITIELISPYEHTAFTGFKTESQAYQSFIEQVGLSGYAQKLKRTLEQQSDELIVIGFSVGGSALWELSDCEKTCQFVKQALCFYSSQLRNRLETKPIFPISYVAPKFEPSFDISNVTESLNKIPNVQVIQSQYLHGFMNENSANFDSTAYEFFVEDIVNFIEASL